MVIHSIMPIDFLVENPQAPAYETVEMGASYIVGQRNPKGQMTVARVISTNPRMYLDPRYSPGNVLGEI
ncbi:MAG: YlzJ-like family protein [Oscillospiraceae bacterium]